MGGIRMRVVLDGYRELRAKLRSIDEITGKPWADALEDAAQIVQAEGQQRAPRRTGALYGAIKYKMQARPVPMWARVSANKLHRGFRYGWALNFSQKRQYRYRSGGRRGQRTHGWFTDAMGAARSRVDALLERAGRAIERNWGR